MPVRNWIAEKHIPKETTFSWKDVPDYILNFTDGAPGGKLFLRSFIQEKKIQYLYLRRSEDFNFIFLAIAMAERVVNLDIHGYFYRNNPSGLEGTKEETPLLFWEATEMFTENLQKLPYFSQLKRSYLNNTINRVVANLEVMCTFSGFSAVYDLIQEIAQENLEMNQHEPDYFYESRSYAYLKSVLLHPNAGEYLLHAYRSTLKKEQFSRTRIPGLQKILGFRQCIRDHGLRYTIKYSLQKIGFFR